MSTIIRGTTPSIKYTFKDIAVTNISAAYLTIKMDGRTLAEKDISTATTGTGFILWTLSQEETLSMTSDEVYIMLNWKLNDGTRGASDKVRFFVSPNYKEVVI